LNALSRSAYIVFIYTAHFSLHVILRGLFLLDRVLFMETTTGANHNIFVCQVSEGLWVWWHKSPYLHMPSQWKHPSPWSRQEAHESSAFM